MMYGKQANRMINNSACGLQPNPDIKFKDPSKCNRYNMSHPVKPEIIVVSEELELPDSKVTKWKSAGLVGAVKRSDTADMRCTSANDNIVPRTLYHQVRRIQGC
jgi:hypothetical protein